MNNLDLESRILFASPFDDPDADLIIRSSDGIYFRVYKVILAKASGVFKGMFTVPQPDPATVTATTDLENAPPIVPLTEDGETLHKLLQLCYPVADPLLASLDDISLLQAVCDKYEIEGLMKNLEKLLGVFMESDPLRVFAIACRAKFGDTARQAARRCLSLPLNDILERHVPEFTDLSVAAYMVLPAYHHRCTVAVSRLVAHAYGPRVLDLSFCFFQCKDCPPADNRVPYTLAPTVVVPRRWWGKYMDNVAKVLREKADPALIHEVEKPSKVDCRHCSTRFSKDLARYLPLLEKEVQDAIDAVSHALRLPFRCEGRG